LLFGNLAGDADVMSAFFAGMAASGEVARGVPGVLAGA